jgi:hypothetical protein
MGKPLTADDVLPIVHALTPKEKAKLLRLILAEAHGSDAAAYRAKPPGSEEFGSDEHPLSWEDDGWDEFG